MIFLINVFPKFWEMSDFSEYPENSNQLFKLCLPFPIQIGSFSFQSRLFPSMKNNGNIIIMFKARGWKIMET